MIKGERLWRLGKKTTDPVPPPEATACDGVARVEPTRPAKLLRELMHMGQMVQSHGMHFFHLAAPDLVLGFDADPAIRIVFGLIQANPEMASKAVNLYRYAVK